MDVRRVIVKTGRADDEIQIAVAEEELKKKASKSGFVRIMKENKEKKGRDYGSSPNFIHRGQITFPFLWTHLTC